MGIDQEYRALTPNEFQQMCESPEMAEFILFGSLEDETFHHERLEELEAKDRFLDIGKDWQAIHFLLTGEFTFPGQSATPPPLVNLVMGGTQVKAGKRVGELRYLTPEEVQAVANLLNREITEDDLLQRMDPAKFNAAEVYPAFRHWGKSDLELLLPVYVALDNFFQAAADEGNYVVILCR